MKVVNLILFIALIALIGAAFLGGVLRQQAKGFAEGGGELTFAPRLLSPETYSRAEAGDNGVAVAITGDRNSVNVAYSQVQPTPAPEAPRRDDSALGGFVGALVVGLSFLACFMYWLMSGSMQGKYQ